MFKITGPEGFHLTFPNGVTLSTQFGNMHYCNNKSRLTLSDYFNINKFEKTFECDNCEIAIWDSKGNWLTRQAAAEILRTNIDDDVLGYVSIDNWIKFVNWCYQYNSQSEQLEASVKKSQSNKSKKSKKKGENK